MNRRIVVFIMVAVVLAALIGGLNAYRYSGMPARVSFSVNVPQEFNATAFKFSSTYNFLFSLSFSNSSNNISNYLPFPYVLNGTARAGETYTLTVQYFSENVSGRLNGLNVNELPQFKQLGTLEYFIEVQELSDNRLSTYDYGFYVWTIGAIFLVILIWSFICFSDLVLGGP